MASGSGQGSAIEGETQLVAMCGRAASTSYLCTTEGGASGLRIEQYLTAPHGGWNDLGRMGRRALTAIRCGHHELRCCTDGWEEIDEEDGLCPLCATAVETEQHFLLDCEWHENGRKTLFDAIDGMVTTARTAAGNGDAFVMQQLGRDAQWKLMTGGTLSVIGKEESYSEG